MTMLSPGPPSRMSTPPPPISTSSPSPPSEGVVAGAADQDVVTVTAVEHELRSVGPTPDASITSSPPKSVDADGVVGVEVIDHDRACEAGDHQRSVLDRSERHDIVTVGAVDDDGIVLVVTGRCRQACQRGRY